MIRIGIRRQIPICLLLACLLLACCCCLLALRLPGEVAHFVKMDSRSMDRNVTRPTNAVALESSPYCPGGLFFLGRNSRFGGVGSRKSRPKVVIFP